MKNGQVGKAVGVQRRIAATLQHKVAVQPPVYNRRGRKDLGREPEPRTQPIDGIDRGDGLQRGRGRQKRVAESGGFTFAETVAMPANNLSVIFRRT